MPYPLVYDGLWHVDVAALKARVSSLTRAVVVVSPNNPTGSLLSVHDLHEIDALNLPVLADEVFAEYILSPRDQACTDVLQHPTCSPWFVMGGVSKSLGLPEWKLGWTVLHGGQAASNEVLWDALETIADTYLSVSGTAQKGLATWLGLAPRIQADIRDRLRENLCAIDSIFVGSSVSRLHVEAGWFCVLRLPDIQDDETWAMSLLHEAQVLVQPGYFYELGPAAHVVLSLLTPPKVLREGLRRLLAHVHTVSQR